MNKNYKDYKTIKTVWNKNYQSTSIGIKTTSTGITTTRTGIKTMALLE